MFLGKCKIFFRFLFMVRKEKDSYQKERVQNGQGKEGLLFKSEGKP